jgi:hypothetical protein
LLFIIQELIQQNILKIFCLSSYSILILVLLNSNMAQHWWLTPVILVIWEAEMGEDQEWMEASLGNEFTRP